MATSSTDLGVIYNHPSVISSITNNDTIFTSSTGRRPFFCIMASEKGVDNEIKMVTDVNEFLFKYGNPNLKLYGQGAYNVINILNNNEAVYVMRVLPNNAGYSHAFLNIQTGKIGTKGVKNVDGTKKVYIQDISIRPTITFTNVNNVSLDLLKNEMSENTGISTIDNYENNVLFCVVPEGRGKFYDKYGFRIYLNTSYDETYDFRVYNFEVIQYDEYDNASIIEGPYFVSLDPDALSASNESMFIEDVVNKYSKYVKVIFNEKAYTRLGEIINENVPPSHLDFLSGQTRVYDGSKENFFCSETNNYEDVHIYIQKYDSDGKVVTSAGEPITNIIDSTDIIQKSILVNDNSNRRDDYNEETKVLNYMKDALLKTFNSKETSPIYNNLFDTEFVESAGEKVLTSYVGTEDKTYEGAKPLYDKFIEAYNRYLSTKDNFKDVQEASLKLENNGVNPYIKQCKKVMAYAALYDGTMTETMKINDSLNTIINRINANNIRSIKVLNYISIVSDANNDLIVTESLEDLDLEIERVTSYLATTATIISFLSSIIGSENPELKAIELNYEDAVKKINIMKSGHITEEAARQMMDDELYGPYDEAEKKRKSGLVPSIFIATNSLLESTSLYIDAEVMEYLFSNTSEEVGPIMMININIDNLVDQVKTYFSENIGTNKDFLIDMAKEAISSEEKEVANKKATAYTIQLQDFSKPVKFANGTDGDLDVNSPNRNTTLENLLIKGYKGLIDSNLTNRKTCPVRFILDANYSANVKNAIHILVTEIREDIIYYCDLGFTASPEGALAAKAAMANFSSTKIAIYSQDFTVYDEYTGRDIKVTVPYFLASKIPHSSSHYGLQYPIAGNKRGLIDGFKTISWTPNETYKELLYNNKINYIEKDTKRTKFGSQLTSEVRTTPLSNINNVITVLDIKNDVEDMSEDYIFEFNNNDTINTFQNELNEYLATYVNKKAVERISANVYSSEYDKLQKILRVSIEIKFYDIIERIIINLDVVKK